MPLTTLILASFVVIYAVFFVLYRVTRRRSKARDDVGTS